MGGKKLLHETIDQLRGYLTWRHNYGVIIIFLQNQKFFKNIHRDYFDNSGE